MSAPRRLVLLDPGFASPGGHHADINQALQRSRPGQILEIWADEQLAVDPTLPGLRPVLQKAGYIDPRHWCDLAGCLHQAGLLKPQLLEASRGARIEGWVAHSLLPFQLLALAQLLQEMPPAAVVISLMFAPGEVFLGQAQLELEAQRQAASITTGMALSALALACSRQGHRLTLASGSQQLIECYTPLCHSAHLPEPQLHPALVEAAHGGTSSARDISKAQVLLHWGERKPDKGRSLALDLLQHLLAQPAGQPDLLWLFHASGSDGLNPEEQETLQQAAQHPSISILEGVQPHGRMVELLSRCEALLLPYDPVAYSMRSSGVLWLYGRSRLACGQPARVLAHPGSWIAREAPALGMGFSAIPQRITSEELRMEITAALQTVPAAPKDPNYQNLVLGASFSDWLWDQVNP